MKTGSFLFKYKYFLDNKQLNQNKDNDTYINDTVDYNKKYYLFTKN